MNVCETLARDVAESRPEAVPKDATRTAARNRIGTNPFVPDTSSGASP